MAGCEKLTGGGVMSISVLVGVVFLLILFVCKQPYLFDFFRALLVGLQSDPSCFVDVVVTFLFFMITIMIIGGAVFCFV